MAATPLAASSRYINPDTTRFYFLTAVSNKAAPTRSELNAGTDLSGEVQEVEGWLTSSDQVETPDLDSRFTSKIPGRITAEDSTITFYADSTGADARSLLPRDTAGFVIILDGGDVPGSTMDVFPVKVSSVGKSRSVEGSDAATVAIAFSITSEPAEDVTVPA